MSPENSHLKMSRDWPLQQSYR